MYSRTYQEQRNIYEQFKIIDRYFFYFIDLLYVVSLFSVLSIVNRRCVGIQFLKSTDTLKLKHDKQNAFSVY